MVDFVRCLQNRKLLETGKYMVISVDDEIYDAKRRSNIMERGIYRKFIFHFICFMWICLLNYFLWKKIFLLSVN